ncbi:Crp/Fnr family transcriptional regulator [Flavobacterium subsaxonicum]|uniref:Crp/Fnr family transcriptional regulator n=1 Tax=Flavobacterium subsaxonicum WB 4.1-42 = DSM 21790 TaxID=1121898 RepID=A0A0A2MUG2_9FLAO|nr:Crp/Fnr family transcriptional regulator [Flavobacterium subsaxonicum]KGO95103.1 Crp/Fnr family transcriptional regulator [Flavobacterium subsaxonicum WB 4.1-42 = DSM 21790]
MNNCDQCRVRQSTSLRALTTQETVVIENCKTSHIIKKGEAVFSEGENINGIFCIKQGICKLTKLSANGSEQIVKLIASGELLGQRSMISEEPVNLSAVALEDMAVCYIPKKQVMAFFNRNNQFSMAVMKTICSDLKAADDHLVTMAQKPVKQRLAETLLYLLDNFGTDADNSLQAKLTREELAGLIGTATESCIRLLSQLNKSKVIILSGKKIIINDREVLYRLATL